MMSTLTMNPAPARREDTLTMESQFLKPELPASAYRRSPSNSLSTSTSQSTPSLTPSLSPSLASPSPTSPVRRISALASPAWYTSTPSSPAADSPLDTHLRARIATTFPDPAWLHPIKASDLVDIVLTSLRLLLANVLLEAAAGSRRASAVSLSSSGSVRSGVPGESVSGLLPTWWGETDTRACRLLPLYPSDNAGSAELTKLTTELTRLTTQSTESTTPEPGSQETQTPVPVQGDVQDDPRRLARYLARELRVLLAKPLTTKFACRFHPGIAEQMAASLSRTLGHTVADALADALEQVFRHLEQLAGQDTEVDEQGGDSGEVVWAEGYDDGRRPSVAVSERSWLESEVVGVYLEMADDEKLVRMKRPSLGRRVKGWFSR